ncbi:MAG: helix-hairpin-helix domain-containing protein [Acholeplasma sp.]|nr:helix-hairpin-helix domain-containing protein [Acholeplasma sp.]
MLKKITFILFIILFLNVTFWPTKEKEELIIENSPVLEEITVKIEGEVVFPGYYKFYDYIKVKEVVEFAGGFLPTADLSNINMESIIKSNTTLTIKARLNDDDTELIVKMNLNTITFNQLLNIPNITEKRAANIILYREGSGKFKSVSELLNVKYIGKDTYEKIHKYFTV